LYCTLYTFPYPYLPIPYLTEYLCRTVKIILIFPYRKKLEEVEEKGVGSRSKMERDIQHCSTDIQAARSDLQASAKLRVIFSIVAQIFRLQDPCKMESDIRHCSTDSQAARSDLQASERWRVIFSIAH
jgi:hypothetical protein